MFRGTYSTYRALKIGVRVISCMRDAVELIKRFEGFRAAAYQDAVGVWTIGYGSTWIDGRPVGPTTGPLTEAESSAMLESDVRSLRQRLLRASAGRTLLPGQTDALLSFAYNLGFGVLRASTLFRMHLAGDVAGASAEFPRWVHAGGRRLAGLVLRREAERQLYCS